ncbi:MAG TPA: hypothetical protein VGV15_22970 [Terriglobales bacterium]|nr:hypothetical protein [Terriglobales bacterium]
MKRSAHILLGTVLGLILALSAVPGHAQDEAKIKATIPFNFVVGNKELKAGNYVIQRLQDSGALLFRSEDGNDRQIVFAVGMESNQTGNHERLLFHHDGDQYFLSQVWLSGDEDGHELVPGVQEKAAANRSTSNQVAVGP